MQQRTPIPAVLAIVFLLPLGGCFAAAAAVAAAAATYGVIKYTENEARQDFDAGFDTTYAATVKALRRLGYPVKGGMEPTGTEEKIEVSNVTVRVERHTEGFTRVRVRVGTFETDEHQRRARLILEEIQRCLAEDGA